MRIILTAFLFLLATPLEAAPATLTHHGYLEFSDAPVHGAVLVTFSLYDGASAPVAYWTEDSTVDVVEGYYTAVLGRTTPLTASDLALATAPYLGITIEGSDELVPRLPVSSVPYALAADDAALAADLDCLACVGPTEVSFTYARSATGAAGPAADLSCDSCIGTQEIANIAVTTSKIADGAITADKLDACSDGQILRYNGTAGWSCDGPVTISSDGTINLPAGAVLPTGWPAGSYCVFRNGGTCPSGFTPDQINMDMGTHSHDMCPGDEVAGDSTFSGAGFCSVRIYMCCK